MVCFKRVALLLTFAVCVSAVLLDDALVNDWTRHWVGRLQKYSFLDTKSVLGLSDKAQLFQLNLETNSTVDSAPLNWRVDLLTYGAHPNYEYFANLGLVYTYSASSSAFYAWDANTGQLSSKSTIQDEGVIGVANYFNKGVVVIGSKGSVTLFLFDSIDDSTHLGSIPASEWAHGSISMGRVIIVALKQIIIIDGVSNLISTKYAYNEGPVDQLKDDLLFTKSGKFFKIGESSLTKLKSLFLPESSIRLVNEEYVISFTPDVLQIGVVNAEQKAITESRLDLSTADIINVEYISYLMSDYIVVTTPQSTAVYDVAGLLYENDPQGVQVVLEVAHFTNPQSAGLISNTVELNLTTNEVQLTTAQQLFEGSDVSFFVFYATELSGETHTESVFKLNYYSFNPEHFLIVDKPPSEKILDIAHHLQYEASGSLITRWLLRSRRHLTELGRFIYLAISTGKLDHFGSLESSTEEFGLEKYVVFLDEERNSIVVVDSLNGDVVWGSKSINAKFVDFVQDGPDSLLAVYENTILRINLRDGLYTGESQTSKEKISSVILLQIDGVEANGYISGEDFTLFNQELKLDSDKFFINQKTLQGYKLLQSQKLVPTWKFPLQKNENVVAVNQASGTRDAATVGITLSDRSVLYKYLYPNWAAITTFNLETQTLTVYVIDIVTGIVLHTQKHDSIEKIDPESIQVTVEANWIVYSYFAYSPRPEQRIVSIDLFEGSNKKKEQDGLSVLENYNQTIGWASSKSFILPERIVRLSHTATKHGITTSALIAVTSNGAIVQIPKYILNSRRIDDREFTQKDAGDDYRLSPYEPVISNGNEKFYHVLNHLSKLIVNKNTQIIVKPTNLESTSIVCVFNDLNWFCTTEQPSMLYDKLPSTFAKVKLLLTIVVLLAGVLVTKPLVDKKKLNMQWINN